MPRALPSSIFLLSTMSKPVNLSLGIYWSLAPANGPMSLGLPTYTLSGDQGGNAATLLTPLRSPHISKLASLQPDILSRSGGSFCRTTACSWGFMCHRGWGACQERLL